MLDCCAEWIHALQKIFASEMLAAVSKKHCNERAVPAGKCRWRLAYGAPVRSLVKLPL